MSGGGGGVDDGALFGKAFNYLQDLIDSIRIQKSTGFNARKYALKCRVCWQRSPHTLRETHTDLQ